MNSSKPLTKKQKSAKTKKQIREIIRLAMSEMLKRVDRVLDSGSLSQEQQQADNYHLAKAIIEGYFKYRPFTNDNVAAMLKDIQFFI